MVTDGSIPTTIMTSTINPTTTSTTNHLKVTSRSWMLPRLTWTSTASTISVRALLTTSLTTASSTSTATITNNTTTTNVP
jgi:hypothetical protein